MTRRPLRYPVVLTIASPDRTKDNPIRVYLPADHAIRLIKELASSVLAEMGETPFSWEVRNLGVKVAALMTPEIIRRRIGPLAGVSRVILPGRCRGDLAALATQLKVPLERGPEEVKDLPEHFLPSPAPASIVGPPLWWGSLWESLPILP